MNCKEILEALEKIFQGQKNGFSIEDIVIHLKDCSDCLAKAADLYAISKTLAELPGNKDKCNSFEVFYQINAKKDIAPECRELAEIIKEIQKKHYDSFLDNPNLLLKMYFGEGNATNEKN